MKKRTLERKRVVASSDMCGVVSIGGGKAPCVTYYYIAAAVQMGGAAAAVHLLRARRAPACPLPLAAQRRDAYLHSNPNFQPSTAPARATPNRIYSETAWQKRKY
jgi:hypothetical protein